MWQHSMKGLIFDLEKEDPNQSEDEMESDDMVLPSSVTLRKDLLCLKADKVEDAVKYVVFIYITTVTL